jgi:hypothetical protein
MLLLAVCQQIGLTTPVELIQAFQTKHPVTEGPHTLAGPIYEELKKDFQITHFYFMEPDRTCFLRVHQPAQRGDIIDRSTFLSAQKSGRDSWGIEFGPLGTFTLRYVRPWKANGELLGYLELGKEVERLVDRVFRNHSALNFITVIRKEFTSKEKFEAVRKVFAFTGDWESFPGMVVAHQTLPDLPEEVRQWLSTGER